MELTSLTEAPPETQKDKFIRSLCQLPEDLLKAAYQIELVEKRVLCQYDKWLEDKYRNFRVDGKPDALGDVFTDFRIFSHVRW